MNFHIKYGIVSEVKKGFVKVSFEEDDIVSDWLPVLVRKTRMQKESWQFDTNEHVVCIMDEFCEDGVCIGAIPNDQDVPDPGEAAGKFRKKFSDGTVLEYDINSHVLTVDVKGKIDAKTTGEAKVEAGTNLKCIAGVKASVTAPQIELTGNVSIVGALTVSGAVLAGAIATSGGGSIVAEGDITTLGGIMATGDVVAGTKSLKTHVHSGVQPGGGVTGLPQ